MLRLIVSFLLAAALAGCAPATLQGLREKPAGSSTFEAPQNYQRAYRTIITNARKCYQTGMITAQMVVTGDLYNDTKTGEVTVALHGGLGVDTYLGIDIKALTEETTQVKTFHALSSWKDGATLVKQWVLDGSTECGLKK